MGKTRTPEAPSIILPDYLPHTIIVGSGASILKHPVAAAIDSFPRICRFRGYDIATNAVKAMYAGRKVTDIGINTSRQVVNLVTKGKDTLVQDADYLITCHRRDNVRRQQLTDFFKKHTIRFKTVASEDYEKTRNLTSGYLAIMRFLLDYSVVCIHGFCTVDDTLKKRDKKHYFDRPSDNFKLHDLAYEEKKIRELMAEGKVVRLTDLINKGMMNEQGTRTSREWFQFARQAARKFNR